MVLQRGLKGRIYQDTIPPGLFCKHILNLSSSNGLPCFKTSNLVVRNDICTTTTVTSRTRGITVHRHVSDVKEIEGGLKKEVEEVPDLGGSTSRDSFP